jgi:uncharacterized protein YkwD
VSAHATFDQEIQNVTASPRVRRNGAIIMRLCQQTSEADDAAIIADQSATIVLKRRAGEQSVSVNEQFTGSGHAAPSSHPRVVEREFKMVRVGRPLLCAALAVSLQACAVGAGNLTSGFSDTAPPPRKVAGNASTGLGGDTTARPQRGVTALGKGQQQAALDMAPQGGFEKAPAGALADRDFGTTKLDADKARDLVNAFRTSKGLKPLKLNLALTEAAKAHSRDLAKWDRISHFGSDGSNPWDRVKRSGYNAKLAAENVGTGQVTFDEVMKGWLESAGPHSKNLLLADATEMGIALVQDPKTEFKTFWTLVIGASL